jgi:hypothetical protein
MADCPCGPESWKCKIPGLFRFHVPQFVFKDACRMHDHLYEVGGDKHDKRVADDLFHSMMKREIHRCDKWYAPTYYPFAFIYYEAVKHYGKKNFNYTKANNGL